MSEKKLGPWHPEGVRPVHHGVYEVDYADSDGRAFAYWSGLGWGCIRWEKLGHGGMQAAIKRAHDDKFPMPAEHRWRGLVS